MVIIIVIMTSNIMAFKNYEWCQCNVSGHMTTIIITIPLHHGPLRTMNGAMM